jgi:hypothetical protein
LEGKRNAEELIGVDRIGSLSRLKSDLRLGTRRLDAGWRGRGARRWGIPRSMILRRGTGSILLGSKTQVAKVVEICSITIMRLFRVTLHLEFTTYQIGVLCDSPDAALLPA